MRPTRRTQPYRKGQARQPGRVLDAMKRGRTMFGQNPMDVSRASALHAAVKKRRRGLSARGRTVRR